MLARGGTAPGCYNGAVDPLIAHLLHFAVSITGYPAPPEPPIIRVVPVAEMPCACLGATL